jgi:hypothetical protein
MPSKDELSEKLRAALRAAPAAAKSVSEQPLTEEAEFARDLIIRGEAVRLKPGQELPPQATHEIVVGKDGREIVVRRRFFSEGSQPVKSKAKSKGAGS